MMCSGNEGTKEENQLGVVNRMRGCGGADAVQGGVLRDEPGQHVRERQSLRGGEPRCAARLEITATLQEINQGVVRVQLKETHTPNPAGAVPPPAGAVIRKNEAMIIRVRQEVWMREIARRTFTTWPTSRSAQRARTEGSRRALPDAARRATSARRRERFLVQKLCLSDGGGGRAARRRP